jgi:hypothetical protein
MTSKLPQNEFRFISRDERAMVLHQALTLNSLLRKRVLLSGHVQKRAHGAMLTCIFYIILP